MPNSVGIVLLLSYTVAPPPLPLPPPGEDEGALAAEAPEAKG